MLLNDLIVELNKAKCLKFGSFELKNKTISPVYVDFRVLVTYPHLLKEVGEQLCDILADLEFDRIAGIPYAAIPLALACSFESGLPMLYPRKEAKEHGTARVIEGEFLKGETAVVIDDVITDGASKFEAIKPLEDAGLKVSDIVIVLDREQGGKAIVEQAGYKLHSLLTLSNVLSVLVKADRISQDKADEVNAWISAHQIAPAPA